MYDSRRFFNDTGRALKKTAPHVWKGTIAPIRAAFTGRYEAELLNIFKMFGQLALFFAKLMFFSARIACRH